VDGCYLRSRTGTFSRARGTLDMLCDQNIIQPLSQNQLFPVTIPTANQYFICYKAFLFFLDSVYPF